MLRGCWRKFTEASVKFTALKKMVLLCFCFQNFLSFFVCALNLLWYICNVFIGKSYLVQFANKKEILSLPREIDFKGTMVIVRFPAQVPAVFDFYKYIS